jgi:molecular chaperone DnaK
MLKEHREKISDADAKQVEEALEEVKKAMGEGGIDKINSATDKLTTASHKLAEAMYKAQSTGQNGTGAPNAEAAGAAEPEKPKDNVVDAEFVDVDDKK